MQHMNAALENPQFMAGGYFVKDAQRKRALLGAGLTTSSALCCLRLGSHCSDDKNRNGRPWSVCHVGQALRPLVEQIVGRTRVALEGQHQAKLLTEPFERFITISCDRSRYNIVPVNVVEAVAHRANRILGPIILRFLPVINEHAVLLPSS